MVTGGVIWYIGLFTVLLTALLGTAVLLYLAWLGAKCVQKERKQ